VIIRSYSVCFQIERRLYRIDRWRLPAPNGVPLLGIGYMVALLVAIRILSNFPAIGWFLHTLHPIVRYLVLPVGLTYLLLHWTVDGRPVHRTGLSFLRWRLSPARLIAFRAASNAEHVARFGTVTIAPDEEHSRMRRGVIEGPARVILRYPTFARQRGRELHLRQGEEGPLSRGRQISLRPGQRVVIG
jgi:conjugation transfer TcpE-like protein